MWGGLASEKNESGGVQGAVSLYLKRKDTLKQSGFLSNILNSLLSEMKVPLYPRVACDEQSIQPFIASHALSLTTTRWRVARAKVNPDNESGFRRNYSRPISLSYTNTRRGRRRNAPMESSAPDRARGGETRREALPD